MTATPFDSHRAHLDAEFERLDLLLRRHLERWWATMEGVDAEYRGLYIPDEEVLALLERAGLQDTPNRQALDDTVRRRRTAIDERIAATAETDVTLRLERLAERFGLSPRARDLLLLAVAADLDEKYAKVYGYLQDDITRTRPAIGLLERVLSDAEWSRLEVATLLAPDAPLRRHGLVRFEPSSSGRRSVSHAVVVDRRIAQFLVGIDAPDEALSGIATVREPSSASLEFVGADVRDQLESLRQRSDLPTVYYFSGPSGSGPARAVDALCAAAGAPVVTAPLSKLAAGDDDVFERLRREATLRAGAIHLEFDEPTEERAVDDLVARFEGFDGDVFFTGTDPWIPASAPARHELSTLEFPQPTHAQRTACWRARTDSLPPDADPDALASTYVLTQGQIDTVVDVAVALSDRRDGRADPDVLSRVCRSQSTETLGRLTTQLEPTYDWDDIVLPTSQRQQLEEVAAAVRHRTTVHTDWGFDDRFSLGNGIVALFSGPSGTGKTMAAEVIAADAGLDLYKIDLSSVVSKYIGETEENLREIFDEAAGANAILLFDEADALFGKRSDVSDAHDRYANIEVNYLLQRIEAHDGAVILTTNFDQNVDDAFRRRITATVEFKRPDEAARGEIWRSIFPEATPVGELDYEFLAGLSLTGGNIRNVAQLAAFLAADDDSSEPPRLEMRHVVRAVRREFQKTGQLLEPGAFGEYQGLVTER